MRRIKRLLLFAILMNCFGVLFAQNGINSPYSRFGLGLLGDQSVGSTRAMGGMGVGLRKTNSINMMNPASYSTVDTLTFLADFGFSLQNGNYKENGIKVNAKNTSIDHLVMQFRILPKVGMTLGMLPYSNSGYSFSNESIIINDVDGETASTKNYTGTGGIHQLIGGFGWKTNDIISIGANFSYLYGDLSNIISNTYSDSKVFSRTRNYSASISTMKFDFGVQSTFEVGEETLVVGATFTPKTKMRGDCYLYDLQSNSSTTSVGDTIEISNAFSIPNCFAIGASLSGEKLTLGADISYQTWSSASFWGKSSGKDRLKISLGGMYQPSKDSKKLFNRSIYRFGAYYQNSYYCISDNVDGPKEYGISAGLSMPIVNVYNGKSTINISGQFVHVNPSNSGLITENYFRLNVGISFNERWFYKWQVE